MEPNQTTAAVLWCDVVVYNPEVVYKPQIVTGCQASKLDYAILTLEY